MSSEGQFALERTYAASLKAVWELWTTKEGFESWWGPEGFTVTVQRLDLRVGGELRYTMTATAPEAVTAMKQVNAPLSTEATLTYTEIRPMTRLAYRGLVDFVPGVAAYPNDVLVELSQSAKGVRMCVTVAAMHDETWTKRAHMGWESQLRKLDRVLAERG